MRHFANILLLVLTLGLGLMPELQAREIKNHFYRRDFPSYHSYRGAYPVYYHPRRHYRPYYDWNRRPFYRPVYYYDDYDPFYQPYYYDSRPGFSIYFGY